MRDTLNKWYDASLPCSLENRMTCGMDEQSSRNWMKSGWLGLVKLRRISARCGCFLQYSAVKVERTSLAGERDPQCSSMCSISSGTSCPEQEGHKQNPSGLLDQNLHNFS